MFKLSRGYILILVLILGLPTLFFSIYEFGTLRKNEKVIEEIYTNQLDAILFSVNQYSEDVLSNWAGLIGSCLTGRRENKDSCLTRLTREFPSVSSVFLCDREKGELLNAGIRHPEHMPPEKVKMILEKEDTVLNRLESYYREGYRKITSFYLSEKILMLAFYMEVDQKLQLILLIFSPEKFINDVLDPRIQQVAQENFYIAVLNTRSDTVVYASDRNQEMTAFKHRRKFWLMPDYEMGIELMDTTISDLVRSRSKKNLLLIGIIDLVLFLGIWFIYRNVRKQLELSQLKSDFVSNVSHEIRTPLALITMYIETLEMGRIKSPQKVQEYYKVIQQETLRLTSIVNKILSFSQIESGKRQYSFEKVNLNHVVQDVIDTYSIRLNRDGFTWKVDLDDSVSEVNADREAVADAMINLLDNAMKYSDTNKHIELSTSLKGTMVWVDVRDQGIGISEHDQKQIFDKFYRVTEKNLALKAKGSGLGLAIVKHIMDAHQGSVQIESKKGQGSRFILKFPTT